MIQVCSKEIHDPNGVSQVNQISFPYSSLISVKPQWD